MARSKSLCFGILNSESYQEFQEALLQGDVDTSNKLARQIAERVRGFVLDSYQRITGLDTTQPLNPMEAFLLQFGKPFNGPVRMQFGEALSNNLKRYLPQFVSYCGNHQEFSDLASLCR